MRARVSILIIPILLLLMAVSCYSDIETLPIENINGSTQSASETTMSAVTNTETPVLVVTDMETDIQISSEELSDDQPFQMQTSTITPDEELVLDPQKWEDWPLLPLVSKEMIDVYHLGLEQGTNPNAFSVFGDCQSLPDNYMGGYETGEFIFSDDYQYLQRTIDIFSGSFNRESTTVKKGATVAAILWEGWVDADSSICEYGETPLECEIRVHNPSIVVINLGTHWEIRNEIYLRKIVEELIARGIVPIISTKADTREGDAWINAQLVQVADDFQVPMWNFWLAVQPLENHGMKPDDRMYMTEEGLEMQRLTSLMTLDTVFRQLNEMPFE